MAGGATEAGTPTGNGDLSSRLAGAARVMAAEAIVLSVAIIPLLVGVDLVGGVHHHCTVLVWFYESKWGAIM